MLPYNQCHFGTQGQIDDRNDDGRIDEEDLLDTELKVIARLACLTRARTFTCVPVCVHACVSVDVVMTEEDVH